MKQTLIIKGELTDLNTYIQAERTPKYGMALGAKIKREETERVHWLAKKLKPIDKPVRLKIHWVCKNRRKDKSNIRFAVKFVEDGLVSAGILKDDSWRYVTGFEDTFSVDKVKPRVEVEIIYY